MRNYTCSPVYKRSFKYLLLSQLINTFIIKILFFYYKHSCELFGICVTMQFMKKDLLLVNPPITLEERYGSFASVGSQAPPLGLCYLAASARNKRIQCSRLSMHRHWIWTSPVPWLRLGKSSRINRAHRIHRFNLQGI